MATSNFLVFDEQGNSMLSDLEYQSAAQRISGVVPGLAEPEMHNKLYRQVSMMCAAIAKVLVDHNLNAQDTNLNVLANNISSLFVFNVLEAYPVGAIYLSVSAVNPGQIFGGTWEQISGRFLLAAGNGYAAGSTGGAATHTLTINEMPSHNHAITVAKAGGHYHTASETAAGSHTHTVSETAAGAHSHTVSITSAGAHTHTRGTMNIVGSISLTRRGAGADDYFSGALFEQARWNAAIKSGGGDDWGSRVGFDAARTWTGETSSAGSHTHTGTISQATTHTHTITAGSVSNHTHTITIANVADHLHTASAANAGGGQAHNNMPPYLAVFVWKRVG